MACILPSGYILALFVIQKKGDSYWAHHVCVDEAQKAVYGELWDSLIGLKKTDAELSAFARTFAVG